MTMDFENWGLIHYDAAFERQKALVREVAAGRRDVCVFCEHPAVITQGRKTRYGNIFLSPEELGKREIALVVSDRGGDVTLHSPGQLVVYPVVNLKRAGIGLRGYLLNLEQVVVDFLGSFGIVAQGDDDRRGVWVDGKKAASIGIAVSRWVSYHGVAVNINNDLGLFCLIRPCGLAVGMTSLSSLLGRPVEMSRVYPAVEHSFQRVFNVSQ